MWCVLTGAEAAAFANGLDLLLSYLEIDYPNYDWATPVDRFNRLDGSRKIAALYIVAHQLLDEDAYGEDNTILLDSAVEAVYWHLWWSIIAEIEDAAHTTYRQIVSAAGKQLAARPGYEWQLEGIPDVTCKDDKKWASLIRMLIEQSQDEDYDIGEVYEQHMTQEQRQMILDDYFTAHVPRLYGQTDEDLIADIHRLIQSIPDV